jgi:hypothetical protein
MDFKKGCGGMEGGAVHMKEDENSRSSHLKVF